MQESNTAQNWKNIIFQQIKKVLFCLDCKHTLTSLLESCFTPASGLVGYNCQIKGIPKPNEDHDGGNDDKQKEASQKASKDMNLENQNQNFLLLDQSESQ